MAKLSDNILDKARNIGLATPQAGMSVPDGYFGSFVREMAGKLPYRPEIEDPEKIADKPATLWQKVRAYVYMAAMFAGVWCMLNMFASMTNAGKLTPMADNPVLAEALSDESFMSNYLYDDIDAWGVVDEMMLDGTLDSPQDFGILLEAGDSDSDSEHDYLLPQ